MKSTIHVLFICVLLLFGVASCGKDDNTDDGDNHSAEASSSLRTTTVLTAENLDQITEVEEWRNHTATITSLEFSPDGTLLASGSEDLSIRIWDFASGEQVGSLNDHTGAITDLAFSADGQTLVSTSLDGTVRLWNLANAYTGGVLGEHEQLDLGVETTGASGNVEFSADGSLLVTGHGDGMIRVWDFATRELQYEFGDHSSVIFALAFNADETLLASGGRDRLVKVWDFATGELIVEMRGHTEEIYTLTFSADSTEIYSTSNDRYIRGWSLSDGRELWRTLNSGGTLYDTVVIDGLITAATGQSMILFYDPQTGQRLPTMLRGHNLPLHSIALNPEGTILVSGSEDFTIRLWYIQ